MKGLLANKPLALTLAIVVVAAAAAAIFFFLSPDVDEPPAERGVNTGQGPQPGQGKPPKAPKPPKPCKPKGTYGQTNPQGPRRCPRPKPG
jgi:hypothetical protein